MKITLGKLEPRVLEILARAFSGGEELRVLVSHRAKFPVTLVLESRTIVLCPITAGLYDLALAACCFEARSWRDSAPLKKKQRDRWLTHQVHERLVPAAHEKLQRLFPNLASRAGGYVLPGRKPNGLRVAERQVDWLPLPQINSEDAMLNVNLDFVHELDQRGAGGDLDWIRNAIVKRAIPLESIPTMDEWPYATIPFRVSPPKDYDLESFERIMQDPEVIETKNSIIECVRRKSEVLDERQHRGKLQRFGVHLDHKRLINAAMAPRTGIDPKVFRKKSSQLQPIFDPDTHLAMILLDLNDISTEGRSNKFDGCRKFLLAILKAYGELEVDMEVVVYADTMVTCPDGRKVICHFTNTLKTIDQPLSDNFWAQLGAIIRKQPRMPFPATHYHPISARRVIARMIEIARERPHAYRTLFWLARRGKPEYPYDYTLNERMASYLDNSFDNLQEEMSPSDFDAGTVFLPDEIKSYQRRNSFLSKTFNYP